MDGERFVFIDETAATTAMTRLSGWSPKGERLVDAAPAGHWKTTTVVAGLRASGIIAPFVLSGPMTGEAFRAYVAQVLAPELEPGDAVVMDNLPTHKVPGVEEAIRAVGASVLYLPSLYRAFDVKLYFQALHRCRAPSFSRVVVSSCPETGSDGPHRRSERNCGAGCPGLSLPGCGGRSGMTWRISRWPSPTMMRSMTSCKIACLSANVASFRRAWMRSQNASRLVRTASAWTRWRRR